MLLTNNLCKYRELTKHDSQLKALKVTFGCSDTNDETLLSIKEDWSHRDKLTVHNGVIFRGNHVIIPKVLQPEMLAGIHTSHLGAETCLGKSRDVIYWTTMNSEVKDFIRNFTGCNDYLRKNSKGPLISHTIPSKPWSQVVTGMINVFDRNYLITLDFYSNFWELDTIPNSPTAVSVIRCCKRNFSRYGIPDVVVAYNTRQLDCKEFEQFAKEWEFECSPSDPHHSQSNGKAESAMKIAKKLTKKTEQEGRDLWKAILDWRNTPTKEAGSIPT